MQSKALNALTDCLTIIYTVQGGEPMTPHYTVRLKGQYDNVRGVLDIHPYVMAGGSEVNVIEALPPHAVAAFASASEALRQWCAGDIKEMPSKLFFSTGPGEPKLVASEQ